MPTPPTLDISLYNTFPSPTPTLYATITGLALDADPAHQNARFLLLSDGRTPYFPASPSQILSPLGADCAIPVKSSSSSSPTRITIPHLAGARIYLSVSRPLTFFLNPGGPGGGAALVEPSVTNASDPNAGTDWAFAEFTFNADQLYANISYVDFVGVPIGLALRNGSGETKEVRGMGPEGREAVARGLVEQAVRDGVRGWGELVVRQQGQEGSGRVLRILSPNQAMVQNPDPDPSSGLFAGYFEPYVEAVWAKYAAQDLQIDTQAAFGVVRGRVRPDHNDEPVLDIAGQRFAKPSTHDIFHASSGPFATGPDAQRNAIIPRLNAAFNRSTLLACEALPAPRDRHYRHADVTNHYARLVHEANADGRGYAHPYDDVAPSGAEDVSGFVSDGDPRVLEVFVGGGGL